MQDLFNIKEPPPIQTIVANLDSPSPKILTEVVALINKVAQISTGYMLVLEVCIFARLN
jgi:hypothetical protein